MCKAATNRHTVVWRCAHYINGARKTPRMPKRCEAFAFCVRVTAEATPSTSCGSSDMFRSQSAQGFEILKDLPNGKRCTFDVAYLWLHVIHWEAMWIESDTVDIQTCRTGQTNCLVLLFLFPPSPACSCAMLCFTALFALSIAFIHAYWCIPKFKQAFVCSLRVWKSLIISSCFALPKTHWVLYHVIPTYPATILHHLSVSHHRGLQSWTLWAADMTGNLFG